MDQDKYLPELITEKESLDPTSFVHAMRLLAEGKLISSAIIFRLVSVWCGVAAVHCLSRYREYNM